MAAEPRIRPASGWAVIERAFAVAPADTVGERRAVMLKCVNDGLENARSKAEWITGTIDRFEGPLIRYATRITGDLDRADVCRKRFCDCAESPMLLKAITWPSGCSPSAGDWQSTFGERRRG